MLTASPSWAVVVCRPRGGAVRCRGLWVVVSLSSWHRIAPGSGIGIGGRIVSPPPPVVGGRRGGGWGGRWRVVVVSWPGRCRGRLGGGRSRTGGRRGRRRSWPVPGSVVTAVVGGTVVGVWSFDSPRRLSSTSRPHRAVRPAAAHRRSTPSPSAPTSTRRRRADARGREPGRWRRRASPSRPSAAAPARRRPWPPGRPRARPTRNRRTPTRPHRRDRVRELATARVPLRRVLRHRDLDQLTHVRRQVGSAAARAPRGHASSRPSPHPRR